MVIIKIKNLDKIKVGDRVKRTSDGMTEVSGRLGTVKLIYDCCGELAAGVEWDEYVGGSHNLDEDSPYEGKSGYCKNVYVRYLELIE